MIFRGFRNGVKQNGFYVECDFGPASNQVAPGNLVPGPYPVSTAGASDGQSLVFNAGLGQFVPGSGGGGGSATEPVKARAASTATIGNLSNVSVTQDGITLTQGDVLFVKDAASPDGIVGTSHAYDGPYTVGIVGGGFAPLTRLTGFTTGAALKAGFGVYVQEGTVNDKKLWRQTTAGTIVVNTTVLSWFAFEEKVHTVDFQTSTADFNFVFGGSALFAGSSAFDVTAEGTIAMTNGASSDFVLSTSGGGGTFSIDGGDGTDSITIGTNIAVSSITMGTVGVPVLFNGGVQADSAKGFAGLGATFVEASGALVLGGNASTTSIAIGQATVKPSFPGGLTVGATKSITTTSGALLVDATTSLSIGATTATSLILGRTAVAPSLPGGVTVGASKAILGSGALDVDATGLLQLGVNTATTSMNVGHGSVVPNFPAGILIADTKALTGGGALTIDSGPASTLVIGPTLATTVSIGRSSHPADFPGGLTVPGGQSIMGTGVTTYSIDAAGTSGILIGATAGSVAFASTTVRPIFNAGIELDTGKDIKAKSGDVILNPIAGGGIMLKLASTQSAYLDSSGRMSIGASNPNANAVLDLQSTTRAFMPPRMTTTQRDAISSPTEGMQIWNTTTSVPNFYNGASWKAVTLV